MKKIVVILFLTFTFTPFTYSQVERFNKRFDFFGGADGCYFVQETNYGYLLCGTAINTNNNQVMAFVRIDEQGNEIEKKLYDLFPIGYSSGNGLFDPLDSSIYLVGTIRYPDSDIAAHLTKINQYGDTIWTRTISDTLFNTQGLNIYRENNGDFLIVGATDKTDPNVNMYLIKTDSLGNFIWDKEYGTSGNYEHGWSIDKCDNDSGYIIGGGRFYFGPQIGKSLLIKIDSSGTFLWQYEYGSNAYTNYAAKVIFTVNNKILSSASKGFGLSINNDPFLKPNLLFLDDTGAFVDYREYSVDSANYVGFEDLYEINSNEYLFTGTFFTFPDQCMGLLKTNAIGDTIFGRTYQGVNQWEFSKDVKPTSDGGYIIAGYNYIGGGFSQDFRVIKVDSLGCDTLGCETVGITEQERMWSENENLLVFPNPSDGKFYVEIKNVPVSPFFETRIEVFDITGNLVYQSGNRLFQNLTEVDIQNSQSGIYLVRVYFNDSPVGSIRVVKQ